jgi:hypothetical protein
MNKRETAPRLKRTSEDEMRTLVRSESALRPEGYKSALERMLGMQSGSLEDWSQSRISLDDSQLDRLWMLIRPLFHA